MNKELEKHTMRSAYTRWLILHGEEWRLGEHKSKKAKNWFCKEIRKLVEWEYEDTTPKDYWCGIRLLFPDKRYTGKYEFYISDETLMRIERPSK